MPKTPVFDARVKFSGFPLPLGPVPSRTWHPRRANTPPPGESIHESSAGDTHRAKEGRRAGGTGEGTGGAGVGSAPAHRASLVERLRRHVTRLEGVRHPSAAPEQHRAARDYVAAELSALGLTVDLVPFTFRRRSYHNVVGVVPGRDPGRPRLLVGAHFDSTAHTPGADDNASDVAALLECARLVSAGAPATGGEFVGFDLEELQPITGRYRVGRPAPARAKRARAQPPARALILEMVGYRDPAPGAQIVPPLLGIDVPRTGDFLAAVGDGRSVEFLSGLLSAAHPAGPPLPARAS